MPPRVVLDQECHAAINDGVVVVVVLCNVIKYILSNLRAVRFDKAEFFFGILEYYRACRLAHFVSYVLESQRSARSTSVRSASPMTARTFWRVQSLCGWYRRTPLNDRFAPNMLCLRLQQLRRSLPRRLPWSKLFPVLFPGQGRAVAIAHLNMIAVDLVPTLRDTTGVFAVT